MKFEAPLNLSSFLPKTFLPRYFEVIANISSKFGSKLTWTFLKRTYIQHLYHACLCDYNLISADFNIDNPSLVTLMEFKIVFKHFLCAVIILFNAALHQSAFSTPPSVKVFFGLSGCSAYFLCQIQYRFYRLDSLYIIIIYMGAL